MSDAEPREHCDSCGAPIFPLASSSEERGRHASEFQRAELAALKEELEKWRALALEAEPLLKQLADGAEWTEAFQLAKRIRVERGELEELDDDA